MNLIFRSPTSLSPDSPLFWTVSPIFSQLWWRRLGSATSPIATARYPGKSNRRKDFFCVTIQGYSPSRWENRGSRNQKQQATHYIQLASPLSVGAQGTRTHVGWVFLARELNQCKCIALILKAYLLACRSCQTDHKHHHHRAALLPWGHFISQFGELERCAMKVIVTGRSTPASFVDA